MVNLDLVPKLKLTKYVKSIPKYANQALDYAQDAGKYIRKVTGLGHEDPSVAMVRRKIKPLKF